jgi:VCBS repeat-containing protein
VNILPADIAPTAKYSAGSPTSWTGGVVKGRVKGTDKDKDRLTYITSGSTAKGGTVILDAATGRFSYTPTPAARQAAASGDPAAKTDTFTVTVDDGHGGHIPVTVTVKISPASN